jgi:hypothetical protein
MVGLQVGWVRGRGEPPSPPVDLIVVKEITEEATAVGTGLRRLRRLAFVAARTRRPRATAACIVSGS